MACMQGCVNPELGKHHQKCPNYGRRCYPSGLPLDSPCISPSEAAETQQELAQDLEHCHEDVIMARATPSTPARSNDESTLLRAAQPNLDRDTLDRGEEFCSPPDPTEESMVQQGEEANLKRESDITCCRKDLHACSSSKGESMVQRGADSALKRHHLGSKTRCHAEELRSSPYSQEEPTLQQVAELDLESEMICLAEELRTSSCSNEELTLQQEADVHWESEMMCRREELHGSPDAKSDRRIRGAAATLGGVAGVLVSGPVAGVAMAAVAAYTTTRENDAGRVLRKASSAYLQVTDEALDMGLEVAHQVLDEGCKQFSKQLEIRADVNTLSVPAPQRIDSSKFVEVDAEEKLEADEAQRMRKRFPDRIPVLCERSPYSDLPAISKKKFAVPGSMLCGEFKYFVQKHFVQATTGTPRAEQTIYIFVNGIAPKTGMPMSELYAQLGPGAGFLHVRYSAENTLGCMRALAVKPPQKWKPVRELQRTV